MRLRPFLSLLAILPAWAGTGPGERVDFNFEVRPILSDRCFFCHGPDEKARKAKLRLDQREGLFEVRKGGTFVVKPGQAEASELVRRIFTTDLDTSCRLQTRIWS